MNNLLGRGILGLAGISLVVQLIAGYYLVQRLESGFSATTVGVALVLELSSFLVLSLFSREFYSRRGLKFSQLKITGLVLLGQGFSKLVPFGDYIAQRYYFGKKKLDKGVVFDYVITLYSFAILWLVGLFLASQVVVTFLYPSEASDTFIGKFVYFPIGFTVLLLVIFLLRHNPKLKAGIQKFCIKTFGRRGASPFRIVAQNSKGKRRDLMMLLPLAVTWLLESLVFALCIYSFGINPPLILVLYVYFFVKLFRFVPIFPAGIGQIETVASVLFAAYGYPVLPVVAGSILFRLISYWLPVLLSVVSLRLLLRAR